MAPGGPALELAIGKGRIALPLASQGIGVDTIDTNTLWGFHDYSPSREALAYRSHIRAGGRVEDYQASN